MFAPTALATIFGPVLVTMGLWTLLYQDSVKKVSESFRKTPAVLYLGGVVNLIVGLTIITSFSDWTVKLEILVTLLGWLMFLRGLILFFLPNLIIKMCKVQEKTYILSGFISVIWGLALCWLAFM